MSPEVSLMQCSNRVGSVEHPPQQIVLPFQPGDQSDKFEPEEGAEEGGEGGGHWK